ncbi:MAG: D-alanyl-D-alanine carboxypeptidase [Coleofasciculus sp. S288]|nr:D-alanyl-D-alanine carboxypeptidase [Coleofasciculus sp. S288]
MLQRFAAGLLASGVVAVGLKFMGIQPASLGKAQLLAWQTMPLFTILSQPDPVAEEVMHQYLKEWSKKGATAANQGIWIQSGMTKLADHQGKVPLPAASLTKIATTLASLEKWGLNHQFETLVSATGPIKNGVLQGDLVITGSGDPFFVWEEAIALANSLNQLGIRRVAGNLVIEGDFYMNYREEPIVAGQFFRQVINSSTWNRDATYSYSLMPPKTPKPQVMIAGVIKPTATPIPKKNLLLRHKSLSLIHILREMNIYSNNAVSEMLAKSVGGAQVTAELAAKGASVPQDEILLVNGSGLGMENRISPRAATAMLMAIERYLEPHNLTVADLFPVSGRDKRGTMYARHMPLGSAIKTGTLREVSALAGVLPTRDRGLVWFAIINRGGDVGGFRQQQDLFLTSLSQKWGIQPPANLTATEINRLLGDPKRNEKISVVQTPRPQG